MTPGGLQRNNWSTTQTSSKACSLTWGLTSGVWIHLIYSAHLYTEKQNLIWWAIRWCWKEQLLRRSIMNFALSIHWFYYCMTLHLLGTVAKNFFTKSKLPIPELSYIWWVPAHGIICSSLRPLGVNQPISMLTNSDRQHYRSVDLLCPLILKQNRFHHIGILKWFTIYCHQGFIVFKWIKILIRWWDAHNVIVDCTYTDLKVITFHTLSFHYTILLYWNVWFHTQCCYSRTSWRMLIQYLPSNIKMVFLISSLLIIINLLKCATYLIFLFIILILIQWSGILSQTLIF